MALDRKDFSAFFAALHDGYRPFAWQERLLDELLESEVWPGQIVAPTGAGKTAAIDVHVFAIAYTADRLRLPRRLAMVVGRRVLVDDQYEHANRLREKLLAAKGDVLEEVATRLQALRWPAGVPDAANEDQSPLVVARLRGGAVPSREWRDYPTACAVICGTPDMWGSRLLFRGYGTPRRARSRDAGLLALDAAVVVDEAHLSRQLLTTARQVAGLAAAAEEPVPVPVLQVVETTATPAEEEGASDRGQARQVGVAEEDLATEEVLHARLCRPKPVTLVPVADWPADTGPKRRRVAARLADQTVALLEDAAASADGLAHTVGCYVNSVSMAVETASALRARKQADGGAVRVVMVCGQTRPADLERLRREHEGVLDVAGNRRVDVLVSTQSLEVGVDLDLAAVVTELAPASALAQRAGRANRLGQRSSGPVHVIAPEAKLMDRDRSGPYRSDELAAALLWLRRRATDPDGLAPWSMRADPPPPAVQRRLLYQRPALAEVWQWARTTEELAAEPQLDLWLADSFDDESTVELVVRDAMPADPGDAVSLVRVLPPRDHETLNIPLGFARAIVAEAVDAASRDTGEGGEPANRCVVRVRGDDVSVVGAEPDEVAPGDVVVVDSGIATFTPSQFDDHDGFSPPVPVPPPEGPADAAPRVPARDVFHDRAPARGETHLRLEPGVLPGDWVEPLLTEYAELADELAESGKRDQLQKLLESASSDVMGSSAALLTAVTKLLSRNVRDSDLVLHRDAAGFPTRLLLVDRRRALSDEVLRQTWVPADEPVSLAAHQHAVDCRARSLASLVGLPAALVDALCLAGRHHDDGKADRRFQTLLTGDDQDRIAPEEGAVELVAKSRGVPLAGYRRRAEKANLPRRWRHEQYSVVVCWKPVRDRVQGAFADLVVRLVGTSHGYGRASFPHTAGELLDASVPEHERRLARDLFDLGRWDELVEKTHHRWGVWGCAYLEALLRAADCQVSGEGR